MVDLERSRPVALLKDRSAETLAEWLKAYPDIKIVSRDRALAYAKGIRLGTPDAIQVADRFHLLQNLAETLAPGVWDAWESYQSRRRNTHFI